MLTGTTIHEAAPALADTTVIAWRISLLCSPVIGDCSGSECNDDQGTDGKTT